MALHLHNTLTRTREPFEPGDPAHVTMYVCGPTVYNYAHIGNARPPVVFDVLQRLLRRSYRLTYARNITDVDDKINAAAEAEGVEIGVLTARYVAAFQADMAALGVAPPDVEPRVTQHMEPIIGFIEALIAAGHAYVAEGHVLFDVPSYPAYGQLSGRDPEDMLAGARVDWRRTSATLGETMPCGFGACAGCVVPVHADDTPEGYRWVKSCVAGPVFDVEAIVWDRMRAIH
jgi:cysteinyl-tRNA synthetase